MDTRRPWLVLTVLLLPIGTRADDHNADLFVAAPSYASGSRTFGFHLSAEVMGQKQPKPRSGEELAAALDPKTWSAVGDLSLHSGRGGTDPVRAVFMVGARYTMPFRKAGGGPRPVLVFIQALSGVVHTRDSVGKTLAKAGNVTDPAVGAGFGLDFYFTKNPYRTWGVRTQLDFLWRGAFLDESEVIKRASVGVIYRFNEHH